MQRYWDMDNDQIRRLIRRKVREHQIWVHWDTPNSRQARMKLRDQINELSAILAAREAQMFLL